MPDDVKSKISELEKELYSTNFKAHRVEDILPHKDTTPVSSWDEILPIQEESAILKHHLMMKRFVQFSVGVFVLALSVAGFIWYRGSNIVSGGNIPIDITAPVAASGGEAFETKFTVTNSNKVSIEAATLFVEYPAGFYSVPNNEELPRISKDLGMITPGQSVTEAVNTVLYGQENTTKEITVTLEYRMTGSNATLKKKTTYSVNISSSPINVKLALPKEMSSGQAVEFAVEVGSNSKDPLRALVVDASYPAGFTFESATPAPTYGTNVWKISDLAPQEKRIIKIRGVIEGLESEEKVIKISAGTESPKDERLIGIMYNATTESSVITKPFLALDIAVNNNKTQDSVASLNKGVRVDVLWQSNNPTPVTDAAFEIKLKGEALNRYSIYASAGGFYRSIDDTIVWEKSGLPELRSIEPGAKGSVSFSFSPRPIDVNATTLIKNPRVTFEVRVRARRTSNANLPEDIATFATRTVKFETDLRLSAKGTYFAGPFKNTGPLPPQADKETTYTISLAVHNSSNSVSNALVKTTLPIYVKWLGNIYPEGEELTYNTATSEVIWNAGRIPAGGAREASFQISLLPSLSQINQAPKLTGDMTLVGTDDFTKTEVRDQKASVTTYLPLDPQFGQNQANVVN